MKPTILIAALLATCSIASAQETLPNKITTDLTLEAGQDYLLNGYTYVVAPATLTIEPGVTVYAGNGQQGAASALIVSRGAKIQAEGTAAEPIIFTSNLDSGNLTWSDTGLWGGIVILGNGVLNSNKSGTLTAGTPAFYEQEVEGMIPDTGDEALITYGGTDNSESSGVLRYVSIRHGGIVISTGNELNGLTLGGVGSGTIIENVEVFANKDDGVEIFGGAVNLRNIVVAFSNDDSLDLDTGWNGKIQNLFVVQGDLANAGGSDRGDKGGEWDGADTPNDGAPFMNLELANATFIGIGNSSANNNTAINIKANGAAKVWNSIFVDYNKMIQIDNDAANDQLGRFNNGDIAFEGNIWWSHNAENNTAAGLGVTGGTTIDPSAFFQGSNRIADAQLNGIARTPVAALDPSPSAQSPALTGAVALPEDGFFVQTDYVGAFAPGAGNWAAGWTKLSEEGYFAESFNSPSGWVHLSTLGWVYSVDGDTKDSWLFVDNLQRWVFSTAVAQNGGWVWVTN